MNWTLRWVPAASRDMKRLDKQKAARVREALTRFAETEQGDVKQLTDVKPPEWRLRVGDQRVRFRYFSDERIIQVLRVLPRGKAYS